MALRSLARQCKMPSLPHAKLPAALFFALIAAALASSAIAGAVHWRFSLVNKSNVAALEFRTRENGQWSANWIKDRIEPGDRFEMDFGERRTDCLVRTEIRFADGSFFDADVDYCKASTLYVYDDKLTWD
jgi:hypothetical protein